jgi:hypothetical protein
VGLSIVSATAALYSAVRILRRAAPKSEEIEFCEMGSTSNWTIERLQKLSGPVGQFVREVQSKEDTASRIDCVSERLLDVDIATRDAQRRVAMWSRVALFSGVACSLTLLCEELDDVRSISPGRLLVPFLFGATAAFGCQYLGRLANDAAKARRRYWDTLSSVLLRPLLPEQFDEGLEHIRARSLKSRCRGDA